MASPPLQHIMGHWDHVVEHLRFFYAIQELNFCYFVLAKAYVKLSIFSFCSGVNCSCRSYLNFIVYSMLYVIYYGDGMSERFCFFTMDFEHCEWSSKFTSWGQESEKVRKLDRSPEPQVHQARVHFQLLQQGPFLVRKKWYALQICKWARFWK